MANSVGFGPHCRRELQPTAQIDAPWQLKIYDPRLRFLPSSPPCSKSGNPRTWVGLVWSNDCVGRVLPSFEVHRPNTTALDQKKSCFRSPRPQGHSWEEGLEATPGAMSGRQRLVTNLRQGPFPTPMTPLGAVATPSPPHQPLQPHPFLSPSCPPAWIFPKQSATQHIIHNLCNTPTPLEENSHSCPVSPGLRARDRKTAQQTGTLSQQQAQSSNHAASETGLLTRGRLQESPVAGAGTLKSPNLGQVSGILRN